MFVISKPCARTDHELHQQQRGRKLCSATLSSAGSYESAKDPVTESDLVTGGQTR